MIELHDKGFDFKFFDQIVQRKCAVFPSGKGNQTIVVIFSTVSFHQFVEFSLSFRPIHHLVLKLFLPADIAGPFCVELQRFVSFGEVAGVAVF